MRTLEGGVRKLQTRSRARIRVEGGVGAKPTFAKAFDKARCLVPVNGFYEWTTNRSGRKRPVWITRLDDQPFALGSVDKLSV